MQPNMRSYGKEEAVGREIIVKLKQDWRIEAFHEQRKIYCCILMKRCTILAGSRLFGVLLFCGEGGGSMKNSYKRLLANDAILLVWFVLSMCLSVCGGQNADLDTCGPLNRGNSFVRSKSTEGLSEFHFPHTFPHTDLPTEARSTDSLFRRMAGDTKEKKDGETLISSVNID